MIKKDFTLGLSFGFHDSAISLLDENGNIAFACQEERFTRIKNDRSFPVNAINYELEKHIINSHGQIKRVCFHEQPSKNKSRLLWTFLNRQTNFWQAVTNHPIKITETLLNTNSSLKAKFQSFFPELSSSIKEWVLFDHHVSHAAATYFPISGLLCAYMRCSRRNDMYLNLAREIRKTSKGMGSFLPSLYRSAIQRFYKLPRF